MFNIQNVGREHIQAACSFPYKGYTVSMSSIFQPKDICVLLNGEFVRDKLSSVQKAIEVIDSITNIKKLITFLGEEMRSGIKVIDYIKTDNPQLIADLKTVLEAEARFARHQE